MEICFSLWSNCNIIEPPHKQSKNTTCKTLVKCFTPSKASCSNVGREEIEKLKLTHRMRGLPTVFCLFLDRNDWINHLELVFTFIPFVFPLTLIQVTIWFVKKMKGIKSTISARALRIVNDIFSFKRSSK